jgi:hypothetical protein
MKANKESTPMCSVYAGRTAVGFILNRGARGFEAYDVDECSLGMFASQREAAAAIAGKAAP